MLPHVGVRVGTPLRKACRNILHRLDHTAFLAFHESIERMREQDVVCGDFVTKLDREIEVLRFPRVAQAAHGFVGEGVGEGLSGRGGLGEPINGMVRIFGKIILHCHPHGERESSVSIR